MSGNRHALCAYLIAGIFTSAIAYDLLRMPVQVYDSLNEILEASRQPSAVQAFTGSFEGKAYMRPLRIAQIKALFDLSQGHYWLAYRGFHVLLLGLSVWLFTRALRVQSANDLAAAIAALTVLTGMTTFKGTVQEAFPINRFLEIALACLIAFNLAQSRGGWWIDAGAAVLFAAAVLTLESGLLVWVVVAAARAAGFRGISNRGVAAVSVLLAGYLAVRFVWLDVGTPGLSERSSGFWLAVLEPEELERRFAAWPYGYYAYNVAASVSAVLFSEPQSGVFVAVRAWLQDEVRLRVVIAFLSAVPTTALIVWMVARLRRRTADTPAAAAGASKGVAFVAAAVLVASAVLSYAYTKDEIMSTAGVFYALASFHAFRAAIAYAPAAPRFVAAGLIAALAITNAAWAIRSAGLHHVLRLQAYRQRGDWAVLPSRLAAEGRPFESAPGASIVRTLRAQALALRAPNPEVRSDWPENLWGD